MGFLDDWELTYEDVNLITTNNPSMQSFVIGYAAEAKVKTMVFDVDDRVTGIYKPDDHDRAEKGDWVLTYNGERLAVEVKSLQSTSLRPKKRTGLVQPNFQCDASDRRSVVFSDGSSVETTALLVGEFDVMALNLRALTGNWDFVFIKNEDLPRMDANARNLKKYTEFQLDNLIKTTIPITLTSEHYAQAPYRDEPFSLFDEILEERRRGTAPKLKAREIDSKDTVREDGEG